MTSSDFTDAAVCTAAYDFGPPTFFIPCQRPAGHRGKHRYRHDEFMAEWEDDRG